MRDDYQAVCAAARGGGIVIARHKLGDRAGEILAEGSAIGERNRITVSFFGDSHQPVRFEGAQMVVDLLPRNPETRGERAAEAASANSESRRLRTGSSATAAVCGSPMTSTASMSRLNH